MDPGRVKSTYRRERAEQMCFLAPQGVQKVSTYQQLAMLTENGNDFKTERLLQIGARQ